MTDTLPTLAVLGGTGAEGSGLAFRWAHAGYPVIIGSRTSDKAEAAVADLAAPNLQAMANDDAAAACDIAVLTVPFSAQKATLEGVRDQLQGKILVDVTVPLMPPKVATVQLPAEGSAAQIAQAALGEDVKVVSAFQTVSASHLKDLDHVIDCDVLVCGNDKDARAEVITLVEAVGMRGIHGGVLANAAASEALTSVMIAINRRYKVPGAGIRITGLPEDLGG